MAFFPSGNVDMQFRTINVSNVAINSHDSAQIGSCPVITGYTPMSVVFDDSDNYTVFIAYLTSYGGNSRIVRLYNSHANNWTANGSVQILYVRDNLPTS